MNSWPWKYVTTIIVSMHTYTWPMERRNKISHTAVGKTCTVFDIFAHGNQTFYVLELKKPYFPYQTKHLIWGKKDHRFF